MENNFLTREDILGLNDITTKEITVPATIPAWGGKKLIIKQLTRGQQDAYMKRQFGQLRMRQDRKMAQQEITSANIYGHDTWLFIQSVVDASGRPLFTEKDEQALSSKSGEAIGWVAKQVIEFSGMLDDIKDLEKVEDQLKNSQETQI